MRKIIIAAISVALILAGGISITSAGTISPYNDKESFFTDTEVEYLEALDRGVSFAPVRTKALERKVHSTISPYNDKESFISEVEWKALNVDSSIIKTRRTVSAPDILNTWFKSGLLGN